MFQLEHGRSESRARNDVETLGEISDGRCVVIEAAVCDSGTTCELYVNCEDSEWSSTVRAVAERHDTAAVRVSVRACSLAQLCASHGPFDYIKVDIEGGDGDVLEQLKSLPKPRFLSFELNSMEWLRCARDLGYDLFRLVAQNAHRSELLGCYGEPAWSSGAPPDCCRDQDWSTFETVQASALERCVLHADESLEAFAERQRGDHPVFSHHDFAVLKPVFPLESKDLEQWFDVHCTSSSNERT